MLPLPTGLRLATNQGGYAIGQWVYVAFPITFTWDHQIQCTHHTISGRPVVVTAVEASNSGFTAMSWDTALNQASVPESVCYWVAFGK